MPGRYPQIDTIQFRRKLDSPKRNILLAAGQGNITKGFENILAIYQHLHSMGYRVENPLESISLVTIESANKDTAPMQGH